MKNFQLCLAWTKNPTMQWLLGRKKNLRRVLDSFEKKMTNFFFAFYLVFKKCDCAMQVFEVI
jgi:hypothetical protein